MGDHPHRHGPGQSCHDVGARPRDQLRYQFTRELVDHRAPGFERSPREARLNLLAHPRVRGPVGHQQHRQLHAAQRHAFGTGQAVVGARGGADVGVAAQDVDVPFGVVMHRAAGEQFRIAGIRVGGGGRIKGVEVGQLHARWNGSARDLRMGPIRDIGSQRLRHDGAVSPREPDVSLQSHQVLPIHKPLRKKM